MDLSRNRGGIQRGDREETGDLEAGGDGGSNGDPTANADALEGGPTDDSGGVAELNGDTDFEDLTIHEATDPDLGLTDIGDVPPEDWAADTGPTRSGETASRGVDRELVDHDRDPSGRKVELRSPSSRK